jgi:hypothetical protein
MMWLDGLFCFYGPLEPWFDKVWGHGEIEFQLERKIRIRKGMRLSVKSAVMGI